MTVSRTTGLGEPEPIGKKALFQRPAPTIAAKIPATRPSNDGKKEQAKPKIVRSSKQPKRPPKRVRITTELTRKAMLIIQEIQNSHRLKTGKVLPLWKAVSEAIEFFGRSKDAEKE